MTPSITIALSRTIDLGKYESAKVEYRLNDVPEGATQEQIDALMETGALAYSTLRKVMGEKAAEVKATHWEKVMGKK